MSYPRWLRSISLIPVLAMLFFVAVMAAQQADAPAAKEQKVAALKQSIAQNQTALKSYSWTETRISIEPKCTPVHE